MKEYAQDLLVKDNQIEDAGLETFFLKTFSVPKLWSIDPVFVRPVYAVKMVESHPKTEALTPYPDNDWKADEKEPERSYCEDIFR